MHALVVDDSRTTRRLISEIMSSLDFQVTEAADGRDALDQLQKLTNTDVVLVDWNMPIMNGIEFVKAVRSDSRYANLPLLMVTTETEMEQIAQAFVAGVNEYLMKPFDAEMVRDKLAWIGIGV
jgi:two-component system chemotaxis response regulator CheY